MRKPKRRQRRPDPLASPRAVREVLERLRRRLPDIIPEKEKDLVALLRASLHAEKYPASETRRGRPARWAREELLRVMSALRALLGRGTWGRKEARTFVDHYLPLLSYPADVLGALEGGEVTLFEAEQLARLTPRRLGVGASSARSERTRLLRVHLESQEPCGRLRDRVSALLGESTAWGGAGAPVPSPDFPPEVLAAAAELEAELATAPAGPGGDGAAGEVDPGHLFFDHLRMIAEALREVRPEDLTDEVLDKLYASGDELLLILQRLRKHRQHIGSRLLIYPQS